MDIINKCFGNNNITRTLYDQRILMYVPYIVTGDDEDICTDIQTLYNTTYPNDNSYGTSYRYTIPPYLDGNIRRKEKFTDLNAISSVCPNIFTILSIVIVMIIMIGTVTN